MKKVLLTILTVVLILGALGAAGLTGYRYGLAQGLSINASGNVPALPQFGFGYGPQRMPMHGFGFDRGFGHGYGMMGYGFFSPLWLLLQVAFWALVIWAVYTLITRGGWRITRTTPPAETTAPSNGDFTP